MVILLILTVLGLVFGSFINALVWRLNEQDKVAKKRGKTAKFKTRNLSILKGRSMCPHCQHELAPADLIPVVSWLMLRGACRYCHKPISPQYPFVELLTAMTFVFSYAFWPIALQGGSLHDWVLFGFWLVFLVGLIALAVYDIKWYLLPDKIVYVLMTVAVIQSILIVFVYRGGAHQLVQIALSFVVGGGLFYLLFQISNGKWIGGGDVKLGVLLGLILANPGLSLMMLFSASLLGSAVTLPLLLTRKISRNTHIPFGPFLITGVVIARLFGAAVIAWYRRRLLL